MSNYFQKLTKVGMLHHIKLLYRSALLIAAVVTYLQHRLQNDSTITAGLHENSTVMLVIWAVFMVEMVWRFFPSKLESPGCQKQFHRSYIKTGNTEIVMHDNNATPLVLLIWISFNALFGALYLSGIFDDDIMIILCCVYSVCDIICILFFCPFQTWFMKNKCCVTCRIYNWDYAMMFTPLFFVKGFFAWSLLTTSMLLLARWELTFFRRPERFSENTNAYLSCKNCTEKLCRHKKQLRTLWVTIAESTKMQREKLKK